MILYMIKPAVSDLNYQIFMDSEGPIDGILSIPHSGESIPTPFIKHLTDDLRALMEDVDLKVDQLVDIPKLTSANIAVVVATLHRCAVDLNRPSDKAVLNWKCNSYGVKLVTSELDQIEEQKLLNRYYHPYFNALEQLIEQYSGGGDIVPIIDLHSMPSQATAYHLKLNPNQPTERPDFCISDYNGKSCHPDYIKLAIEELGGAGFSIGYNEPYQGGHITRYYTPKKCNIIQIETNRKLYMDEKEKVIIQNRAASLRPTLTQAILQLTKWKSPL
jgi:N-formylglutamate deformylase